MGHSHSSPGIESQGHLKWDTASGLSGWRRGVVVSVVLRINEVTLRRARLVLGWVTVFGRVYHLGM